MFHPHTVGEVYNFIDIAYYSVHIIDNGFGINEEKLYRIVKNQKCIGDFSFVGYRFNP